MDELQRQQALNINQSFIVQAPAGSGKTELLTQRYLALLAKVSQPEEILALTFTRKAAQEMRHRILLALQEAKTKTPLQSSHQSLTRTLASQALLQDQTNHWQILNHPQRLKITTFDAYCLELYQSIPNSEQVTLGQISEYPDWCYKQAIKQWFDWCREHQDLHKPLEKILVSVQNQPFKLFQGLITLLQSRDQWFEKLQDQSEKDEDQHLATLKSIILSHWQPWAKALPQTLQQELMEVTQDCLKYIPEPRYPHLRTWQHFSTITKNQIQELSQILMTKDLQFRKVFNHHIGLNQDCCPKPILKELQQRSQELLEQIQAYPKFEELLILLPEFPDPNALYLDWDLLQAYYQLLPLLIAFLHLEFENQECSDFIYVAQQARRALEETDIGLYLENQLHHLLIDEFQDTSWSQLKLIEQLIQDWEQTPDKSLFIVGDPMQSIYRFRSADVGIFLSIQKYGFPHLKLKPLYLKQNFRSDPLIIQHLNQHFSGIFPEVEEIYLGGVPFHPAHPALERKEHSLLQAYFYENTEIQTHKIINIIQEAQTKQIPSLAILVKNRKQLSPIIQALQAKNINYQGLDLHPLGALPHIRDIWNLCQLLLNPGARINECAVLRGPLVGLSLNELHALANLDPKASVVSLIQNLPNDSIFSSSTLSRLKHFSQVMAQARIHYYQYPLSKIIQELLISLQVKQLFPPQAERDTEIFLNILERFDRQFSFPDVEDIQQALDACYISAHQQFELQIMTIHKSKGLEFDWVIIPNMGDASRQTSTRMLNWYPSANVDMDKPGLFIHHDPKPLQQELLGLYKWFEKQQSHYENQRLCYVALTRAKSRLYLLDNKIKPQLGSFRSLFQPEFFIEDTIPLEKSELTTTQNIPEVNRLPLNVYITQSAFADTEYSLSPQTFQDQFYPKLIGRITHRLLQWICEYHPQSFAEVPWSLAEMLLAEAGPVEPYLAHIQKLIQQFWNCPIGTWIRTQHAEEENEYPILIRDQHIIRKAILDRTFVENNRRWIIDFKTDTEAKDMQKYRIQVNRYAEYMQELHPGQNIFCGLYFLKHQTWKTWAYDIEELFLENCVQIME